MITDNYQLIKTMTTFERETRHPLEVSIKKKQLTWQNVRQQCAHMMCSVHLHRHDMLTVPLTVLLHYPITSMKCTVFY